MKKIIFTLTIAVSMAVSTFAQQDAEGTKDPPMFPNRMTNYFISESTTHYDAVDFNIAEGGSEIISKEGTKTMIHYDFNFESSQSKPSPLQILRNYEAAAKKIGGETQFLSPGEGIGVFKIVKTGSEVWVKIETGGSDNNDFYFLTILEIEAMKQEIISNEIQTGVKTEGTKDLPMFANRMTNYFISESTTNYDAVDFNLAEGGSEIISKEGTKTLIHYDFNFESGQSKPSVLQILRNYEAAVKKIGGATQYLNVGEGIGVFKIVKTSSEFWVKIETGGSYGNDFYYLTVLEIESMNQEITSNDILTALNTDGRIALYINFETGKSDIKTESQKTIDQIVEILKSNLTLKISIEGHTDNVGTPQSNQTLSENRAKSVMNAILSKGIDKARLSAKGWGQDNPISDNTSEDGRAKNRRVEIVKL